MNKWMKWIAPAMLAFALSACGTDTENEKPGKETNSDKQSSYTVKDDRNKEITFDKVPEKVISLAPSNTEILFELGAGDKIIGATEYDHYPEEAKKIERVADAMKFNAEKIISLKPDAVFAYTLGEEEALNSLEAAGIKVFVIQSANSFDDVYGDIEQIAAVMGVEKKGMEIAANIKKTIADVQEKVKNAKNKPKVYYEISPAPEIFTVGRGTFQHEFFDKAHVDNIFGDLEGWPKISEEEVLKRNPDVMITTTNYIDDPIKEMKGRKGWSGMKAVQEDQVHNLDADIMSRPGPRIGQAVELLAKTIYPDLMK